MTLVIVTIIVTIATLIMHLAKFKPWFMWLASLAGLLFIIFSGTIDSDLALVVLGMGACYEFYLALYCFGF